MPARKPNRRRCHQAATEQMLPQSIHPDASRQGIARISDGPPPTLLRPLPIWNGRRSIRMHQRSIPSLTSNRSRSCPLAVTMRVRARVVQAGCRRSGRRRSSTERRTETELGTLFTDQAWIAASQNMRLTYRRSVDQDSGKAELLGFG